MMHPDNAEAVDDLVERLRNREGYVLGGPMALMQLCEQAANAIEQKDKLIAELRGALAERAGEGERKDAARWRMLMRLTARHAWSVSDEPNAHFVGCAPVQAAIDAELQREANDGR